MLKLTKYLKWQKNILGKFHQLSFPERKPQQEPKQNGPRTSILKAPSKLSYVQMGYRAPTLDKNSARR